MLYHHICSINVSSVHVILDISLQWQKKEACIFPQIGQIIADKLHRLLLYTTHVQNVLQILTTLEACMAELVVSVQSLAIMSAHPHAHTPHRLKCVRSSLTSMFPRLMLTVSCCYFPSLVSAVAAATDSYFNIQPTLPGN